MAGLEDTKSRKITCLYAARNEAKINCVATPVLVVATRIFRAATSVGATASRRPAFASQAGIVDTW